MPPFRHHGVPYFSQWSDPTFAQRIVEHREDPCLDPTWRDSGFDDPHHYRFWARRICGLACLRSMLAYWQRPVPNHRQLLEQAIHHRAYVVDHDGAVGGLFYGPFAHWLREAFGLNVRIYPRNTLSDLTRELGPDSMAMASVSAEIRYPLRPNVHQGGHLVLLHGCDGRGIWFHNPSGSAGAQADVRVPRAHFKRFFANRGMVIRTSA